MLRMFIRVVGVLLFEREIGQQSGMHDQGVVLGELEPEREGGQPLPILLFELIGHPLVGRLELGQPLPPRLASHHFRQCWSWLPRTACASELPKKPNNPERIRPFGDQISDQNQLDRPLPTPTRPAGPRAPLGSRGRLPR